jgi:hypothetical protein
VRWENGNATVPTGCQLWGQGGKQYAVSHLRSRWPAAASRARSDRPNLPGQGAQSPLCSPLCNVLKSWIENDWNNARGVWGAFTGPQLHE